MSEEMATEVAESPVDSAPEVEVSSQPESSPAPEATAAEPQQQNVWSAFSSLPDFQGVEEREIAQRLYQSFEREKAATQRLAQYQQLIPYAQEYLQYREPFERWMQEQSAPQQQSAPAPEPQEEVSPWWNPPEVRETDKRFLTRDENGREAISEDAPPHVRERLYEYQRYKAEFAQKFLANPEEALGPMVEQIAQRKADEMIESRMQEQQEVGYIAKLEEENRDWLYDQQGNPTPEGLAIQRYIGQASDMGVTSPEKKWEYATAMVERDLLSTLRQRQQQPPPPPQFQQPPPPAANVAPPQQEVSTNQAQKDIEYLRREASRRPSRATGLADPRAPKAPMTFEERLKAQLARDGLV